MEVLERGDLEENGTDNNLSILEITIRDQLNGDKFSEIIYGLRNQVRFVGGIFLKFWSK